MVALTWMSMNLESYLKQVWESLADLEQLISSINDIMESLVDANLRLVSRALLANLPEVGAGLGAWHGYIHLHRSFERC